MRYSSRRLKYLVTSNDDVLPENHPREDLITYAEISDVSAGRPVHWQKPIAFGKAPSRARRLVRNGDVIVSTVRTYLRAIAQINDAPENAVVSTGFAVLRPREIDSGYLGYALLSESFVNQVISRSVGVSYPAINSSDVLNIAVPVPPLDEQRRIADYLDHETAEIDALIAEQSRLDNLLAERRSSAVEAGFSPLLENLVSLKLLGNLQSGITLGARYDGELETRPYIRVANVQAGRLDLSSVHVVEVPESVARSKTLREGDVLMTEGGDRDKLGRGAIWSGEVPNAIHQNHVFAFRCGEELSPQFLTYFLESSTARRYFESTASQSTNLASTNSTLVKNLKVPNVLVQKQRVIAAELDKQLQLIETSRFDLQSSMRLAQERRAALISAAVTGQIDITEKRTPVAEELESALAEA